MDEMLGSRIRSLRAARKLTQEQIANQIGISRQRYARIESGAGRITLEILTKIAKALDVTVGDITRVLDDTQAIVYRTGKEMDSSKKIFDMLDLFYANKHTCERLRDKDMI